MTQTGGFQAEKSLLAIFFTLCSPTLISLTHSAPRAPSSEDSNQSAAAGMLCDLASLKLSGVESSYL